jgi:molybdopterin synthase catalytic subunit
VDRKVAITREAIDAGRCISSVQRPAAGGVNVFLGTVRNSTHRKAVLRLEYEAYEPMAVAEINRILDEAGRRYGLLAACVVHRVGVLLPGETAVAVAVSTSHRRESFGACQFIIDSLKESVPIWKKEVFEDGEVWVSAHP